MSENEDKKPESHRENNGQEELSLEEKKRRAAAEAKAKALERAKQKALKTQDETSSDDAARKAKAAAAAKAKAAAAAKAKAMREAIEANGADQSDEKAKAIAAAKAKAAAAAKAKALAAAKTRAAANANSSAAEPQAEEKPSVNQPLLDHYVKVIQEHLGDGVLEDYYINRLSKDVPTLVAKPDTYYKVAEFLKHHDELRFDYLSEHHGTDFMTHFEVYNHLFSYQHRRAVALKVKIDREEAKIASITPIWQGANWPERETFDLLGITFVGHPNLKRIMLTDDWVGHPLRKDYEPYDVEV